MRRLKADLGTFKNIILERVEGCKIQTNIQKVSVVLFEFNFTFIKNH